MTNIMEGTFWDDHWVLYVSDESLGSTPEAKTMLYVNELEFKFKKKSILLYINVSGALPDTQED